jgi:hypothetical protein
MRVSSFQLAEAVFTGGHRRGTVGIEFSLGDIGVSVNAVSVSLGP